MARLGCCQVNIRNRSLTGLLCCFMKQCLLIIFITSCRGKGLLGHAALYPAIFTFGDSLVDNGNNNYLASLARANFPPNGCDYGDRVPTGRFCNGKTLSDYIGYFLGIDPPPAYFDYLTFNLDLWKGVNFASGAAGILDESGYNYVGKAMNNCLPYMIVWMLNFRAVVSSIQYPDVHILYSFERIPMSQQVEYFALVKQTLLQENGNASVEVFINKALYIIVLGSNDYINNYMLLGSVARSMFTPDDYADLLVTTYCLHIQNMYALGARKILITSVGPLGCLPYEMWAANVTNGACLEEPNTWVVIYNTKLQVALQNLTTLYSDLYLLYGNAYDKVFAYVRAPIENGFQYGNISCCGKGMYAAELPCIPTTPYCKDRSAYVFWDRFHPSDRCNLLVGSLFVSGGSSDVYPMNLLQLATK